MAIAPTRPPDPAYAEHWSEDLLSSHLPRRAVDASARTAVVQGSTRLSYAELAERVDAGAAGLRDVGLRTGDVVCVMLPNWWESMVVMHAVLAVGAVVDPVVPIYRDRELGFILRQATPSVLVIPHRFRGFDYVEMAERLLAGLADPPIVVVVRPDGPLPPEFVAWDDLDEVPGPGSTEQAPAASDIALLLYTSGTTADPKGVLHSHRTLDYEVRSIAELLGLGPEDTVFMPSPVTHITGFLFGVLMPPMLGSTCVLLDVWDPVEGHRLVEDEQCRFTMAATPFLVGLLEQYEVHGTPSALRAFTCGGADVPPTLVRRARARMGTRVVRIYGSSEFPTFSSGRLDDDDDAAAETDGAPIGPVELRLDHESNGAGELLVRGPELFCGYLDPALNEAAFTADGYFRTGDLVALSPDGHLTVRGRIKDIVVRGGEKISAVEIENLLYAHPAVAEVAVVGMADPVLGERVCAFVVPTPGERPSLGDLVSFLTEQRVARQKLPERVVLVDSLPKTASGKVQKFQLRAAVA